MGENRIYETIWANQAKYDPLNSIALRTYACYVHIEEMDLCIKFYLIEQPYYQVELTLLSVTTPPYHLIVFFRLRIPTTLY